jgi:uncharacterized protein YndB with AHSA1/START domain
MTDQIERELLLPAPPEQVWEVITSPGWLAEQVQLDLVPGGEADFGGGKTGWVEDAAPPERLVLWWSADGEPATRVELTLELEGEGEGEGHLDCEGERRTRLRVVESRPLEVLDVTGIPLPGRGGASRGPAMVAAA